MLVFLVECYWNNEQTITNLKQAIGQHPILSTSTHMSNIYQSSYLKKCKVKMNYGNKKNFNDFFEKGSTSKEYVQSETDGLSVAKVFNAISDDKSWSLFSTIAISSETTSNEQQPRDGSQVLISLINLTRKQYYHRLNRLLSLGLINRNKGRYRLSSFGRVLYEIQKTLEIAIQNRWKLAAIDSLKSSLTAEGMPTEDRIKLINLLLGDHDEIKNMILCNNDGSRQHYTLI